MDDAGLAPLPVFCSLVAANVLLHCWLERLKCETIADGLPPSMATALSISPALLSLDG